MRQDTTMPTPDDSADAGITRRPPPSPPPSTDYRDTGAHGVNPGTYDELSPRRAAAERAINSYGIISEPATEQRHTCRPPTAPRTELAPDGAIWRCTCRRYWIMGRGSWTPITRRHVERIIRKRAAT